VGGPDLDNIDDAVRAIDRAVAASDTPVFYYDIEGLLAADGTHRATRHAQRVHTSAATRRSEVMVEAQTGAYQPRDTIVMRGYAGFDAFVAARAFVQVDEQQVLALHQLLLEKVVERNGPHAVEHPSVHLAAGARHFADGGVYVGELRQHGGEIVGFDANKLHKIHRSAGGGAMDGL